jgi:hypothetical protein
MPTRVAGQRPLHQTRIIMETTNKTTESKKNWLTKPLLAKHYQVSLRTISKWMMLDILVYVKVGRVVRFDTAACDAALKLYSVM